MRTARIFPVAQRQPFDKSSSAFKHLTFTPGVFLPTEAGDLGVGASFATATIVVSLRTRHNFCYLAQITHSRCRSAY